jgi:hypothetical protein
MGKTSLGAVSLMLSCILTGTGHAGTRAGTGPGAAGGPDAQGWNGSGWYITGSAPMEPRAVAPDYILLEGPHELQEACLEVYERLYYPIGVCRLLTAKPVAFVE